MIDRMKCSEEFVKALNDEMHRMGVPFQITGEASINGFASTGGMFGPREMVVEIIAVDWSNV